MNLRVVFAFAALLALGACAISQNVRPVALSPQAEVCIIRNADVRPGFHAAIEQSLVQRGYTTRTLEAGASPQSCPTVMTYTANWTWDMTMYLVYARMDVYQNGQPAGEAVYNARGGGYNMGKYISADEKVAELVAELFP